MRSADLPELERLIIASTYADREGWLRSTRAAVGRAEAMALRNEARAAAERDALDAAVAVVIGPLPRDAHGAPTVLQKRFRTAVRRGEISSTFGGTGEPCINALRRSLDRPPFIQRSPPVLAEHPAAFTSTYASA